MYALTVLLAATARASLAQESRYEAWFAGGWHAPISNYSPLPTDRHVLVAGLTRRFHLASTPLGELATTPSILPWVYTTGNRRQDNVFCHDTFNEECEFGTSYTANAAGLLPIALSLRTSGARRVALNATADAGAALFSQRVPATKGARFNFMARFGVDAVVRVRNGVWLSGGYRHLHLSNGGRGQINPGIDTPLWELGVGWR